MENKTKILISVFGIMTLLVASVVAMYNDGKDIAGQQNFYIVSNTEYWTGETGQIIARFTDYVGNPISATNCSTSSLYPNQTTFFLNSELMTQSLISGDWYYQFTVPDDEGVYDYAVTCVYGAQDASVTQSKTFHVNPALNKIKDINSTVLGLESYLVDINGTVVNIQTTTDNIYTDTQDIRANFVTNEAFRNNITLVTDELTNVRTNLTTLMNYCGNTETSGSTLCTLVNGIDTKLDDLNATLNIDYTLELAEINATTHATYDLLSGTVTTTINNIFSELGWIGDGVTAINTTVNTISTNVDTINTNVNTVVSNQATIQANVSDILSNQESEVNLDILS